MIEIEKDFWQYDDDDIDEEFSDTLAYVYPEFEFKYEWNSLSVNLPQVRSYLKRIMMNTYEGSKSSRMNPKDAALLRTQLPSLIHDLEDFFASGLKLDLFDNEIVGNIINEFSYSEQGFRRIEFLPPILEKYYGHSLADTVQIRKSMTKHPNCHQLNENEVRRMYFFRELTRKLIGISKNFEVVKDYVDTMELVLKEKGIVNPNLSDGELVFDGFKAIEDSLSQDFAEILTYESANKTPIRYSLRYGFDARYVASHDSLGIFQLPTINILRTMKSSKDSTHAEVYKRMIKKCLTSNFPLELICENYGGSGKQYYDLFQGLKLLGKLKQHKYASMGIDIDKFDPKLDVQNLLSTQYNLLSPHSAYSSNHDTYKKIDFDKYKNSIR